MKNDQFTLSSRPQLAQIFHMLLPFKFTDKHRHRSGEVGDDVVRLFQHPVVTPRNGVVWMDGLYPFREHFVGMVFVPILLIGHTCQHDGVIDVRVFFHQFLQNSPHRGIKPPLMPDTKHVHTLIVIISTKLSRNCVLSCPDNLGDQKCAY